MLFSLHLSIGNFKTMEAHENQTIQEEGENNWTVQSVVSRREMEGKNWWEEGRGATCCAVLSCFSRVRLFATTWAPLSLGFFRQEYWSGLHSLLQGIFLTQGLNPHLLHRRWLLYCLRHQDKWEPFPNKPNLQLSTEKYSHNLKVKSYFIWWGC